MIVKGFFFEPQMNADGHKFHAGQFWIYPYLRSLMSICGGL